MNVCNICNKVNNQVEKCGTCSKFHHDKDIFLCDECRGLGTRIKHILKSDKDSYNLNDYDVKL